MHGVKPGLDVRPGPHLRRGSKHESDHAGAHAFEQGGLFRVRVGVAYIGDLLPRHAAIHQAPLDLLVNGKAPACRVHANIAEDHLCGPGIRGPAPYSGGLVENGRQLGIPGFPRHPG